MNIIGKWKERHIGEDSPVVGMPYFIKLLNHFISHMCIYIDTAK